MPLFGEPLLTRPRFADPVGRLMSALSARAPAPKREFADLPVATEQVAVPTRHGDVACTVYRPGAPATGRPAVYVNVHGGGFVIRMPVQDDAWCRYLATHAGVVVLNPDYGTAPRYRFPIAAEQIADVVAWAAADERDWDGRRLVVGGQSAGGNLAAAAARQALEDGGPAIALQVLHYPVLDLATPRETKPGGSRVPPRWMGRVFITAYVPERAQREHRLASPVWGSNSAGLTGIAPAVLITAERDELRAEGTAYAQALDAVGALVEHIDVARVQHGYDIRGEDPAVTRRVYAQVVEHVVRAVAPGPDLPAG